MRQIFVCLLVLSASTAARAECILPGSATYSREFSLPRNSVCVIRRQNDGTTKVAVRLSVPPKLGRFGKVSVFDMAYHAGNVAGDDYFEYVSTEIVGGVKKDMRVTNVVHITP